jgi:hypothetical protein
MADRKTKRMTLDLAPAVFENLNRLVDETDAMSKAEVLRDALSLYWFLFDELRDKGCKLALVDTEGRVEILVIPLLWKR